MPAPLAKGAIIAASLIVAAGIAVYQNPQVQQWLDTRRRKIAIALHNLGDEINPPAQRNRNAREADEQRRRREEIIRRNRNELVRRAREEGVAVDLDELARVGEDWHEKDGRPRGRSFDDLVNEHGMLRESVSGSTLNEKAAAAATATDKNVEQGLRHRGSGARGFISGASYANPFADEESVLFDRDLIGVEENSVDGDNEEEAPVPHDFTTPSRESTATLDAEPVPQLVDLSEPFSAPFQHPQLIPVTEAEDATASFYSTLSGPAADAGNDADMDDDDMARSTGTLTPTEDNFSTDASLIGHGADDVAVLSTLQNSSAAVEEEANANPFGSEAGFDDDRFSDASFSDIGARTPSSWTDVGSDFGSETGSQAGH
ncbi:hypothetical protein GTA08_BOTSDO10173 [Neofusicoccum parvum]|uniref:Uncharacterized protein n=1 Tax=Botryosphaeria parva (strain UCR-NP2) TaxID=1287680 RepID=R1EPV5_BOTPV|nr:hypothetical protein UCRNP2_3430 [Neofusicoccum parvum UCRNP2]GME42898.1 hypothetical protein GTA08_BOTSDO10173 [Neofusicoccum parvum]